MPDAMMFLPGTRVTESPSQLPGGRKRCRVATTFRLALTL
jgi:hypothetical protein